MGAWRKRDSKCRTTGFLEKNKNKNSIPTPNGATTSDPQHQLTLTLVGMQTANKKKGCQGKTEWLKVRREVEKLKIQEGFLNKGKLNKKNRDSRNQMKNKNKINLISRTGSAEKDVSLRNLERDMGETQEGTLRGKLKG